MMGGIKNGQRKKKRWHKLSRNKSKKKTDTIKCQIRFYSIMVTTTIIAVKG